MATDSVAPALQIDIISDVMCPWCYVGKRRFEKAAAMRPDIEFDVRWRPFQLDPTIPPEGIDRGAYLKKKFGDAKGGDMYRHLIEAGNAEAIPFAFNKITISPNTLDAHRVIRWSGTAGAQDEVVESLFRGYFTEGCNLTDQDYLAGVAEDAGMERPVVERLLSDDADKDLVAEEIALAGKMGVTGVPCFIFANKLVVMGAQDPQILLQAIDQAVEEVREAVDFFETPPPVN
ncbi:MAG: DsbA family oxidoreductase [Fimbriimonadaceae bacterium]|nr:DsbA family oxidoreductase [Alphaproteobacteria bacterium]